MENDHDEQSKQTGRCGTDHWDRSVPHPLRRAHPIDLGPGRGHRSPQEFSVPSTSSAPFPVAPPRSGCRANTAQTQSTDVVVKASNGAITWTQDGATYQYEPGQNTVYYETRP